MTCLTERAAHQNRSIFLVALSHASAYDRSGDRGGRGAHEPVAEPSIDLGPLLHMVEVERLAQSWLDALPAPERELVETRFGLHGREPVPLDLLGRLLGLDRESLQRVQTEAMLNLKRSILRERWKKAGLSSVCVAGSQAQTLEQRQMPPGDADGCKRIR